ncbi:ROK family transcriptional regulator [Kineococcus sp. G2]|uniref:ROK family transcriptional regulator n=1 Tax=Kineococcus sp. G2 TaxID=3127484 RepID=UPI00301CC42F
MTTSTAPGAPRPRTAPRPAPGGGLRPSAKVLPAQARAHNRAVVLGVLFHSGPLSRADLARATGLTRVTVSEIVAGLVADDLVAELQARSGGRVGKPATPVGLRGEDNLVVAVDLTRLSAVRGAVLDLTGRVVEETTADLHGLRGSAALAAVEEFCRGVLGSARSAARASVLGVGIGTPGVVDEHGTVVDAANLGWSDVPLAQLLTDALGAGVHVVNDANAGALAEFTYGGSSPSGSMTVMVGEGLGAGIVLDGHLVRGGRMAAGEIGHLTVAPNGPPCECGRRGCLETYLSVPRLTAALEGRTPARRRAVLTAAGRRLGAALAPVVAALDLDEVLLSGPRDLLAGPLLDAARRSVRDACLPTADDVPTVRTASLEDSAVLRGAAALVLSGELGFS